jgi:hypothetical protein
MRRGLIRSMLAALAVCTVSGGLVAQTAQPAGQGGRGGRGGGAAAPAPSAPAPVRDLTGVWFKRNPPGLNMGFTGFTFTDPAASPPALTAWGEARFKEARDSNGGTYTLDQTNDPVLTKCYPPGVPRVYFHPYPFEIIQTPKAVLQVFEYDHFLRRMWTDGRPLPKDPDLIWMGHSVGRWEGDSTFVVETIGFNDKTWLDRIGHAHSDQLKVTERFRRVDRDHLQLEFTMEDPVALAKPWTATFYYELRPEWELGEISCSGDYLDYTAKEK